MTNFLNSKSQNRQEELIQVDQDNIEEKKNPSEEYQDACIKRKRLAIIGFAGLLFLECIVSGGMVYEIFRNDLQNRVIKEYEIRTSGQIELAEGVYEGSTDFGYFFGQGKFVFSSGSEYEGTWERNQLQGKGILKVPFEGTYEGEFKNSKKNGNGIFTWDDGTTYEGEWKDDEMCGQGKYVTADNIIYTGTFQDNLLYDGTCGFENETGTYVITYKQGVLDNASITYTDGSTYVGGCDYSGLSGTGELNYVNGDCYKGNYSVGARDGQGVYEWISGDKYDGQWSEDQMSGTGTYTYANGSYASGEFSGNVFINGRYHIDNDFGTYEFTIADGVPTAVEMKLENGTTYSGGMSENKLTGQAQIKYSNGDKYSGNVLNGNKTGQGTYSWVGGASYDGQWSGDQMSGTGTYYYAKGENGYKLVGTFENGKPNGQCKYFEDTISFYKTDWVNGKCVKIYE